MNKEMDLTNVLKVPDFVLAVSLGLAAFLAPVRAAAQPETIDRVAAVVNEDVILSSEIDEQLALLAASQRIDLSDTTQVVKIRQEILNQLIEERLIIDYAVKQGISITDAQLETQVEEALTNVREKVGSEEEFQKELTRQNLTLDGLKERYRQDLRKQLMAQRIVDREIRSKIKINDADVDTFFKNNRDQLPAKPARFHLAHILVVPKADAKRRTAARTRALEALRRLEAGGDWISVCAEFSEDPSTARKGGDLGVAKEGDFDERIEAAIRKLEPGQRSGVVESRFGFHIVELVSREGSQYHARHILLLAQPTPADVAAAIERAEKARDLALKGEAWEVLVNSYSDDSASKEAGGDLGDIPVTALSREYVEALDSLRVGGISPVLQGPTGYHVFKVLGMETGGAYTLEEVRSQLASMLMQKKLSEEYDRWVESIRKKSYIEIKGI